MKIVTYNINGLKSAYKNGVLDTLFEKFNDVDIFCFQEVKAQLNDINTILTNYPDFLYVSNENSIKKGYAGVIILIRKSDTISFNEWSTIDLELDTTNQEMIKYWGGRSAMIGFDDFYLY